MEANYSLINKALRDDAVKAMEQGDIVSVLCYIPNDVCLAFVIDNLSYLRAHGLYEEALFHAFIMPRIPTRHISQDFLKYLFLEADREKLLQAGDPLPEDKASYVVYRGVAGNGGDRRKRGLSWTASLETAMWFAMRFSGLSKPMVYKAEVPKENIFAYSNDRSEQEFVCDIPKDLKLEEVW